MVDRLRCMAYSFLDGVRAKELVLMGLVIIRYHSSFESNEADCLALLPEFWDRVCCYSIGAVVDNYQSLMSMVSVGLYKCVHETQHIKYKLWL